MISLLSFAEIGRDIQVPTLLWAIGIMVAVGVLLGACIILVSKLCAMEEDPRIGEVTERLAGANCGGCGYAGCSGYAKALVEGSANLDACGQTSSANKAEIAKIIGAEVDENAQPTMAVVACAGGDKCNDKFDYCGNMNCVSENMLAGGRKVCKAGCLGEGSCENVCPYNSIHVSEGVAKVDPATCQSCGLCINTCPKKIIHRIPTSATVYIACSTECRGKDVMNACSVGCIGCGMCERSCPSGAITMVNNLPVIDYTKCTHCNTCVAKCPRKIIRNI